MVALKPQRPLFGFLWPAAKPVPQDGQAVQYTWLRVPSRGPWRLALLIVLTALVLTGGAAMVSSLLAAPSVLGLAISIVALAGSVIVLARAWAVGTSVSDAGVKVSRLLTTVVIPWSDVTEVRLRDQSRWLGLPIVITGATAELGTVDGVVTTHVGTASPDLWLRPQATDAAVSTLRTWWRETR